MPIPAGRCHSLQNVSSGPGGTRTTLAKDAETPISLTGGAECGTLLNILSLELQQIENLKQSGDEQERAKILKLLRVITMRGTAMTNE